MPSEADFDAHRRPSRRRWRRRFEFGSSSPGPLSEWCGELADAGPVVVVAQRGGDLGQRCVVKVASVGPVLPLVEGVAEMTPGVVRDAFEIVQVVEHSSSRVHAVVIVDDVVEFVDPAPGRRREFLGSGESIGPNDEDITGCVDITASGAAVYPSCTPAAGLGVA